MSVKKVNFNEEGLNVFFGPLEARIMDILWTKGEQSAKEMQILLSADEPISFNAVMTVLNRLTDKGHLHKRKSGTGRDKVSVFKPVQTKDEFLSDQTRTITHGLVEEFGDYVVMHMLEALDKTDPELIEKLEQKIIELKKRKPT